MLSITVTVVGIILKLPLASVAVMFTVLLPKLAQVKLVWLNEIDALEQLSLLLVTTCEVDKLATPFEFK